MTNNEFYSLKHVTSNLVFIQWHKTPEANHAANQFWVEDIQQLLLQATEPQYFFSDVRNGHATNVQAISRLTKIIQHKNYGGGVALGKSLASRTYVSLTVKIAKKDDGIYNDLESALKALDTFKSGISKTVDWQKLL